MFVKSENTILSALLRWVDYQTSIESSEEKKHLLIKSLIPYINWNEVSEKAIKEFSAHYPTIPHPGKYFIQLIPTSVSVLMLFSIEDI